jgi:uncharacterized membrane protein YgcG
MIRGRHSKGQNPLSVKVLLGSVVVAAAIVSGVVGANPHASAQSAASATPPPPCPTGYTCISTPCSTGSCPTVQAGPTKDLGVDPPQYAFVDLYDFPPGDAPGVWLCADTAPLATQAPLCAISWSGAVPVHPVYAPIFGDGTSMVTYQVPEVQNDGEAAITGEQLGDPSVRGTFFCDDGADPCSLVVFDPGLGGSETPDSDNTVVLPVTYAASGNGCPSATLVNTESDFGIEGLIGAADQAGCSGSHPVIAFNTALDSLSAVTDLASGQVQIAFTDDPNSPDEQAVLGDKYALIPVAVSADVMGFAGYISPNVEGQDTTLYPHTSFELTPNMIAGLVTSNPSYETVTSADTIAGVSCKNPGNSGPKTLDPCPAMEFLNSISGFLPEESYAAYLRSDAAGVTDELLQWLCSAPDHTVEIGGEAATEADTAAQILDATEWSDSSLDGTCPQTDQFPALASPAVLNADKNPQNQAKALYTQVSPGAEPPRQAGFADLNWYEALYFGLNAASIQNASGAFVAPSEASIDAALSDATTEPNGTLSFDYTNTSDTAAYPQPVVFYAAVSTAPQPSEQAAAVKGVLDDILSLTATPAKAGLPPGVVPLTSALTTQAEADIAKDIVALPAKSGGTGGGGGSTQKGSGGGSSGASGGSSPGSGGSTGATTTSPTTPSSSLPTGPASLTSSGGKPPSTSPKSAGHPSTSRKSPPPTTPASVFHAVQVALAEPEWRWLLTGMLAVGAIALLLGPMILLAQRLRTRLATLRRGRN